MIRRDAIVSSQECIFMIDLMYKPISYWIGLAMHVGELTLFGIGLFTSTAGR